MKNRLKIILHALWLYSCASYAQIIDNAYVASFDSSSNFYVFTSSILKTEKSFKPGSIHMVKGVQLLKTKVSTDEIGYTHHKYLQSLNGIPILGSEFYIHENPSIQKFTANGKLIENIDVNTTPLIDGNTAIDLAIKHDGGTTYYWQRRSNDERQSPDKINVEQNFFPIPNLFILNSGKEGVADYKLIYRVRLYSSLPLRTMDYYVDAQTGDIIGKNSISRSGCFKQNAVREKENTVCKSPQDPNSPEFLPTCAGGCQTSSADVKFYGSQYIYTDEFWYGVVGCRHRLKNTCTGTYIYVTKYADGDYRNNGGSWGTNHKSGTTALFSMQVAHDFYRFNLNRNSYDNAYSQIDIETEHTGQNVVDNALWTGYQISIGTAINNPDENLTIDILGHEFTHAVNENENGLIYQNESGALDESFADIFGTMADYYGKMTYNTGWSFNYQFADEIYSGGMRDMSNPNTKYHPDTYNGTYWYNGQNDNGGVHTNSGVQNFWFYLLAEGGSGMNDNSHYYCVSGIGKTKAYQIAYRSLTTYLSSNSGFYDARNYSIQSAIDLFGANSHEVAQVITAWYAVGVGGSYIPQIDVKNITVNAPTSNYNYNHKVFVQNVAVNNGGVLNISSGTKIEVKQNFSSVNGSTSHLYIAGACLGGAKDANPGNGESYDELQQLSTGTNSKTKNTIIKKDKTQISPNPTNGTFKIQLDDQKEYPKQIVIRDVLGRTVKSIDNLTSYDHEFSIANENNGVYVITIYYSDSTINERLIKN